MNIPKHWEIAELQSLILTKKGKKPEKLSHIPFANSVPYLDIEAVEKNIIKQYADNFSSELVTEKEIFVLRTGGRNGLVLNGKNGALGSTLFSIFPIISKKYLFYFLKYKEFEYSDTRDLRSAFWNMPIPVAPLKEQTEIVSILNEIFEKFEIAKKSLAKIPRLLERYRQSVLERAVSGELTEDWREENNVEFEWESKNIEEIANIQLGKKLDTAKNQGKLTKYLRNENVRWFQFNLADLYEMKVQEQEKQKLTILYGDVLICEGGEAGRAAVWRNEEVSNIIFQNGIHRVRCHKEMCLPNWVVFNLRVDSLNGKLENLFTGTTIKHLTLRNLKTYSINLPSLPEQTEIVNRVEKLLKKADEAEAKYNDATKMIDKLQASVLAMAFRGELSEPQPNDEPVSVLLEKIKTEKARLEQERKELQKTQTQIKRTMAKQEKVVKSVLDLLRESETKSKTVEDVWKNSKYYQDKDVERFYDELIQLKQIDKKINSQFDETNTQTILTLIENAN